MKQFQSYQEDKTKYLKVSYNEHEKLMLDDIRLKIILFLLQRKNSTVNKTHSHVKYIVHEMRTKITSLLADFEKSTVKERKKELTLKLDPLIRDKNSCIRLHHELFYLHLAIHKLQDRPELYLIASKQCQVKIQQFENYLQENCSNNLFSVIGKSEHNMSIQSDSGTCCITALSVIQNGQVLVADLNNKTIKLLNQQYQVVSHCVVAASPQDMCQITPSEVAVAVHDSYIHEVQFITVGQSRLVHGRKFQLPHNCYGIAHHQEGLFICSGMGLYKYHTRLNGKLVSILFQDVSGEGTGENHCAYIIQHYKHLLYIYCTLLIIYKLLFIVTIAINKSQYC
ncbi:hypothetical protein DPMN_145604 [Dreissena polymorpha]|uniref:Uncharacterized protein n=1 Tax=Dreissena polymorpha TaxID=45954 RepID=A0A9D4F4C9_DREPO|nr:hypothetical protein DPMN_145604 [Dreissena polymorpha]